MTIFHTRAKKIILLLSILLLSGICIAQLPIYAETGSGEGVLKVEAAETESLPEETESSQEIIRKKLIIIGDSYGMGYTTDDSVDSNSEAWPKLVVSRNGTEDSIVVTKIGAGFVKSNEGESFDTLLERAFEQSDDPASVEDIVICGGYNDIFYSDSTIYYAAQFFANKAKKLFPNAEIHVGMISWNESNTSVQEQLLKSVLPAYKKAAEANGMHYISGSEYIFLNSSGAFSQDNFHPNSYGHYLLADYLSKYIQGKEYFTGLRQEKGGWYWIEDGEVRENLTCLRRNEYGLWYIHKGKVDFGFTGFASNENGWFYVEKGQVTFNKNDILHGIAGKEADEAGEDGWWLVENSQVVKKSTIASNVYGWWKIDDGKVNFHFTGLAENQYGWWYLKEGKVDFRYNGFASNEYGWWYVENGNITFSKNDILKGAANVDVALKREDAWWFIAGSRVTRAETVAQNTYGWWYVNGGKVDFTYSGVRQNEYGWWYIHEGKVIFNYTGFAKNEYGWWYVKNGKVDFSTNSILYGQANTDSEAEAIAGWWLVRNGKVEKTTTVAENQYGWWYVKDGRVDFSYSGVANIDNDIWLITEGKAKLVTIYKE